MDVDECTCVQNRYDAINKEERGESERTPCELFLEGSEPTIKID